MYTIGQLAKRFRLSRSTLLYYDAKDLLRPSLRNGANYRLYSEADAERLDRITEFREAGLSLKAIGRLLDDTAGDMTPPAMSNTLEQRLIQINDEIRALRRQQQIIVKLLGNESALRRSRLLDKSQWVELLRASGMDDDDMWRWHAEFERLSPEAHQDFLEALGIDKAEIKSIRQYSEQGPG
jgi:DNA-binding transcriptional MerR regulator